MYKKGYDAIYKEKSFGRTRSFFEPNFLSSLYIIEQKYKIKVFHIGNTSESN